jgi:hypothetical protein
MEMKFDFINKVIIGTLIIAAVSFVTVWTLGHFYDGLALFLGALWASINLFFLGQLIKGILFVKNKNYLKFFLLLSIKLPLLYLAGYGLLKIQNLPNIYLLIGFSFIFGVIFVLSLQNRFGVKTNCI